MTICHRVAVNVNGGFVTPGDAEDVQSFSHIFSSHPPPVHHTFTLYIVLYLQGFFNLIFGSQGAFRSRRSQQ